VPDLDSRRDSARLIVRQRLLRQNFRKGIDLSVSHADLNAVAAELNSRSRKTLGWKPQPSDSLNFWHQPVDQQCCDDL
jgi:hypothetical protein